MNIAEKNLIITDGDLDVEVAVYAMVNEFYELVIEYCHNDDISPDRSFRRSATVEREETREIARLLNIKVEDLPKRIYEECGVSYGSTQSHAEMVFKKTLDFRLDCGARYELK